jgi:nucleoside-diphosphate-sugar epimerase
MRADLLLTGATGWFGQSLMYNILRRDSLHSARHGWPADTRIRCLASQDDPTDLRTLPASQLVVVRGDVRNRDDCEEFVRGGLGSVLIHAAGMIHPRRTRDFYEVNLEGTENLLLAAAAAGVTRAVVISSNSPIGYNETPGDLFDEASDYRPYMNYGRSKMLMELAARSIERDTGIEVVLIRAPWFYGPHQPERQTKFFRMIRDGYFPIVGDGANRRSMVFTDNLLEGVFLGATLPIAAGRTYWIADERAYTMSQVVETVRNLMHSEFGQECARAPLRIPGLLCDAARIADRTLQGLGLYNQSIHVLSEINLTIACSIAKARNELGYAPAIALEEGMRRSLRWVFDTYRSI